MKILNYWRHFKTIVKHKYHVLIACAKCGIIWRGIKHDLSKFSFKEFWVSAKYFQGDKSPIDAEKIEKGYSIAWQHHKGHNTHHYHYWIDVEDGKAIATRMPYKDIVEMICDWIGAGKAYNPGKWTKDEPYNYFMKNKNKMLLHPDVEKFVQNILYMMKENVHGLDDVYKILRIGGKEKLCKKIFIETMEGTLDINNIK